jgi:hypothetical protein
MATHRYPLKPRQSPEHPDTPTKSLEPFSAPGETPPPRYKLYSEGGHHQIGTSKTDKQRSYAFQNQLVQHTSVLPAAVAPFYHTSSVLRTAKRTAKTTRDKRPTNCFATRDPTREHPSTGHLLRQTQANSQTNAQTNQTKKIKSSTMPPATTTDVETPVPIAQTNPPMAARFGAVMPRPGQPGALYFDKFNISEFLPRWNIECEDFDLTGPPKMPTY